MISLVFQKAHSGCLVEKGLNEIIDIRGFAPGWTTVRAQETLTSCYSSVSCQVPGENGGMVAQ